MKNRKEIRTKQLITTIDKKTLYEEYKTLSKVIAKSLQENNHDNTRDYIHKLKGIAGLSKNLMFIHEVENMKGSMTKEESNESLDRITQIIEEELE